MDYEESLMIKAAWYYYFEEMTQQHVAELMGITRMRVIKLLEKARQTVYASPDVSSTNRNKEIIRLLYEQGVFNIKDAVIQVADRLGISKNTVYLHLRNLKHD